MPKNGKVEAKTLGYQEFVENAIRKLRTEKSKGLHCVYSKLNSYITAYYQSEGLDISTEAAMHTYKDKNGVNVTQHLTGAPAIVRKLVDAGKLDARPAKGGLMVFIKGEMRERQPNGVDIVEMRKKLGLPV